MGACTNDVSREGEGGGYPNSDGRRGRLRDLYSKNSDKGGEGVKNPENLADVICEWPLTLRCIGFQDNFLSSFILLPSLEPSRHIRT